mmetsp:Transcript_49601/g.89776  ORF Transcript_49601/g.89776 Transcript_49601/m.89776 type:complete len:1429 (+) Transcript_49601:240-4526(+)
MAAVTLDLSSFREAEPQKSKAGDTTVDADAAHPPKKGDTDAAHSPKEETKVPVPGEADEVEKKSKKGLKSSMKTNLEDVNDDEHHKELVKEAEAYLQAKLPGGGVFGLFTTSPVVFGQFGIGIELYFRFTRMMIFVMTIMAVLYVPLLIFNLMGDSLKLTDMSNVVEPGKLPMLTAMCKDDADECPDWASEGQCETNLRYMHVFCRKSCNLCNQVKDLSVWEVVGGNNGGILVREGESAESPKFGRLKKGAVVKEAKLSGDSLQYVLITGTGPDTGWVNIAYGGKPLVEKKEAEDALPFAEEVEEATDSSKEVGFPDFWELLTKTMLPNLGTVESVSEPNVTNSAMNDDPLSNESLVGATNITYERNVYLFSKFKIQNITFLTGLLDAVASLLVLFAAWWFEFHEIPRCVASHRNEFVTPRIYSIYVDCLPKRIFGGGGHEAYSKRLKQHFELLLEAQVTTKSATLKMKVVSADENWCRRPPLAKKKRWFNSRFCPERSDGYDDQGRRTGHIIKLTGNSCMVQWDQTAEDESFAKKCRMSNGEDDGELLDADLLEKLESVGLEPVPSGDKAPDHENAVYAVSMQRDFDGALERLKAQASAKDRLLEKKIRQGMRKGRSRSVTINDFKKKNNWEADLDFNADVKLDERDVVGAFVIFTHTQYRDFVHSEYRFTRTPFRQCLAARRLQFSGQTLRVRDAVAPTEVFWNNLDFDDIDRFKRRIIVFICGLLIIAAVIFCVAYAKQQSLDAKEEISADCSGDGAASHFCLCIAAGYVNVLADEPQGIFNLCKEWADKKFNASVWGLLSSLAVCTTCGVSGFLVGYLASVVKPISISDLNQQILYMTTIIYVLCLGVVNVFVNAKFNYNLWVIGNGEFNDLTPKWYVAVGTSTMLTVVANAIFPLVSLISVPLYFIYVRLMSGRKRLLIDLLELYTPPEFPFALRHAEQMSQIVVLLLFCSGMPVLALMTPLTFALHYWCDKWTFLRASDIPPRYSEKLMISQVQLLQIAIWCHSSWSAWTYSNEDTAPSYCSYSKDSCVRSDEDKQNIFARVSERMFRLSAMPSTIISLILMVTLFFRLLFFIIGHNMIVYLEHHLPSCIARFFVGGDFDEFNAESSFVNEISSMKRRGVPINYDIAQAKGYEFLQDDKEKVHADKAAYWRIALGIAEQGRSDNQADEVIKEASNRDLGKGVLPTLAAGPMARTIGAKTSVFPLERKSTQSMNALATDRKQARRPKKNKSSPAAGKRDGLVTVDAVRLSMQGKGKGKGKRILKKKTKDVRKTEMGEASPGVPASQSESSANDHAEAWHEAVSQATHERKEKRKQAKYLSGMDPFPKPDDMDDHLQSLHHEDLSSARKRLGIRRTVHAHEDLIAAAAKKFKFKAKGKGKGEVPTWAKLEEEADTSEGKGSMDQVPAVMHARASKRKTLDSNVV